MTHTTSHISESLNGGAPGLGEPFAIGAVSVPNRLVQAPMAGISGRAFRLQARRFGAGLLTTEMISSYGVHYGNARTRAMLDLAGEEHPLAVQLFGSRPEIMADAAGQAIAAGADIIDINMGCPVRKVVKTGAGVALMGDEDLAERLTAAVVEAACGVPVTVKIRSGLGRPPAGPGKEPTAMRLAPRLRQAGAAALCIHPRSAAQGQKGSADHALSVRLAAALDIPVIASGDICTSEQAAGLLAEGCAAVMIGRASLGNPWIFADMLAGEAPRRRALEQVIAELELFYGDVAAELGAERAARHLRKFYGWYLRPFRPGAELRDGLRRAESFDEALRLLKKQVGTL